jgi:hypothetical protein
LGFDISWIAVESRNKDRILEKVGLRDSGEEDPAYESPFCGADLPNGWFILFANDSEFVSPKRLTSLSAHCRLVACQVHEGIGMSGAFSYDNGREVWSVRHDSERGVHDLLTSGSPPPGFEDVRSRLMKDQDEKPVDPRFLVPIDHIFDIPVETAASVCRYRHDRGRYDWGEPRFTRLDPL